VTDGAKPYLNKYVSISRLQIVCVLLACHVCIVWPTAVHAQINAPREAAQIQIGPLSVYPTLQILDAGKDRNVFSEDSNPKEDFTFTVASKALAVLKLGLNDLMFVTSNDYVWFQQYAQERSTSTRYAMRFNLSASRFKPFIGAERQHTRNRPNPEIDARARRLEQGAQAGFSVTVADRTAITAAAGFDNSSYDEGELFRGADLGQSLNRSGRTVSAGVRYAITPLTSLAINGNYGEDTFPDSHIRDARSYSVVPTLEFSPDAAIHGRLAVGVEKFQPLDATLPEHLSGVYDASLNWSLFGRTVFDLNGSRDTRYSYLDTEPYYLLTGGRLNVSQHLFGPLDLLGGADWEHMSYRWHRGIAASTATVDGSNTRTDLSAGIAVNLGRSFRITVTADQTKRRSTQDPRQNFRRTRLMSSVNIGS
jgi:hypothetical protein